MAAGHVRAGPLTNQILCDFLLDRAGDSGQLLGSLCPEVKNARQSERLRRRARSWKPRKITSRGKQQLKKRKYKRRLVPKDSLAAQCTLLTNAGPRAVSGDQVMVRVRKNWRRPRAMLDVHLPSSTGCVPAVSSTFVEGVTANKLPTDLGSVRPFWLETHLWHAKRFTMENVWGYRLPANNSAIGRRAIHRGSVVHCCAHDRSYMQVIEIAGFEGHIASILTRCGVDRKLILSPSVLCGASRASVPLCSCDSSARTIAPVQFLWQPIASDSPAERKPNSTKIDGDTLPFGVDIAGEGPLRMENDGSDSDEVAFPTPEHPVRKIWLWVHPSAAAEALSTLQVAVTTAAGCSVKCVAPLSFIEFFGGLSTEVVARVLPPHACSGPGAALWREVAASSCGRKTSMPPGVVLALEIPVPALASHATGKFKYIPDVAMDTAPWMRKWPPEASVGSRLWHFQEQIFTEVVPVLLIFRRGNNRGHAAGVDVILPPRSQVHQIWLRGQFASARAMGFRDRRALLAEGSQPDFPFDWPETLAGSEFASREAASHRDRHERRPPAKRPNFLVLGTACPYLPDWQLASGNAKPVEAAIQPSTPDCNNLPNLVGTLPQVARLSLASLRMSPNAPVDGPFVAVCIRTVGRGTPNRLCHLFEPSAEDLRGALSFPVASGGGTSEVTMKTADRKSLERGGTSERAGSSTRPHIRARAEAQVAALVDPPNPPSGFSWQNARFLEPLHRRVKRKKPKKKEGEGDVTMQAQKTQPEKSPNRVRTKRPLCGFITSGCFSLRSGTGIGCGAVSIEAFTKAMHAQRACEQRLPQESNSSVPAFEVASQWVMLWARNPTSRIYFPVWVAASLSDQGLA